MRPSLAQTGMVWGCVSLHGMSGLRCLCAAEAVPVAATAMHPRRALSARLVERLHSAGAGLSCAGAVQQGKGGLLVEVPSGVKLWAHCSTCTGPEGPHTDWHVRHALMLLLLLQGVGLVQPQLLVVAAAASVEMAQQPPLLLACCNRIQNRTLGAQHRGAAAPPAFIAAGSA